MNTPHYLRFARALTLTAVASGCGARTDSDERYGLDAAPSDTLDIRDVATGGGTCRTGANSISCGAGGVCILPSAFGDAQCRFDVSAASPCGSIYCGSGCFCSTTTANLCDCARAVEGPLPPPDLPAAAC